MKRIALISDTHGVVTRALIETVSGVNMIIHAGDLGSKEIFTRLSDVAPVIAVSGNVDRWNVWNKLLPDEETIEVDGIYIYVAHILENISISLKSAGIDVVVFGHTHIPSIGHEAGIIYINPGSPTLPRSGAGSTIGMLEINNGQIKSEIIKI